MGDPPPARLYATSLWSNDGFWGGRLSRCPIMPDPSWEDDRKLLIHLVRAWLVPEIQKRTGQMCETVLSRTTPNPILAKDFTRGMKMPDAWNDIWVDVTLSDALSHWSN